MRGFLLPILLVMAIMLQAQTSPIFQSPMQLVNETQRTLSVKKGQKIDTAYFRTLFLPSARFTVVGQEDGSYLHETMTLDEFLESLTDEYYSNGYFETGMGQIVEEYNGIAQVIQSFEGIDSENEMGKGVNSYQLIYSQGRWWIVNMVWAMSQDNGRDIPKRYLSKKQ